MECVQNQTHTSLASQPHSVPQHRILFRSTNHFQYQHVSILKAIGAVEQNGVGSQD